jgi:ABC-type bacteriocin/lantibiotic exporter with double-glycine peptidase domain
MSVKGINNRLIKNQGFLLLICIGLPLIFLIMSIGILGFDASYLLLIFLLICFLMHFIMMIGMQRKNKEKIEQIVLKARQKNGSIIDQKRIKPQYELN